MNPTPAPTAQPEGVCPLLAVREADAVAPSSRAIAETCAGEAGSQPCAAWTGTNTEVGHTG